MANMINRASSGAPARVLAVNAGSSSIRFALYDMAEKPVRRLRGKLARIGLPDATLTVEDETGAPSKGVPIHAGDHGAAATALIDWLEQARVLPSLAAVGHRVVHGGPKYSAPARVDDELVQALRGLSAYSPEHLPAEIDLIERIDRRLADVPQVACFDTAFHRDMPRVAKLLPIPRRFDEKGIRRFGFHGLSYAFLMGELERVAGTSASRGRAILAHLGNGSSLAAVSQGRAIDTTMAFTPAAGVPMSTRSGDLDPGLAWYLARTESMSAEQFIEKLKTYQSAEEVKKYHRYFTFDENEAGAGDVFMGVRMGQVFALAKEFITMPLSEVEKLLESPLNYSAYKEDENEKNCFVYVYHVGWFRCRPQR